MHEKLFCDNAKCEFNSGLASQLCLAKIVYFVKSEPKRCMTFQRRKEDSEEATIGELMEYKQAHCVDRKSCRVRALK